MKHLPQFFFILFIEFFEKMIYSFIKNKKYVKSILFEYLQLNGNRKLYR